MSSPSWGEWAILNLARLGPGWLLRALVGRAQLLRERNFGESARSRAVWVSEEASSEAFRWIWRPEDHAEVLRRLRDLPGSVGTADRALLEGAVMGVAGAPPAAPFPWSRDPQTGEIFGERTHALRVGEHRLVQELGRLQTVTVMAGVAVIQDSEELGVQALELVTDFDLANPYPYGVHWGYPDEVALRLVSLVWLRALLGWEAVDEVLGDKLLEMVYLHQRYLHLFADFQPSPDARTLTVQAARFLAGLAFPGFPESDEWRDQAASLLEQAILEQTYEDGVGRQQCAALEFRSLELCLLAVRLSDAWDYPLDPAVLDRVERMCEYFVAWHASREPAGGGGDVGAGRAFALPLGEGHRSRSLMAVAAATFDRPEWARFAGSLDPQALLEIGEPSALERYEEWIGATQAERYLPPEVFPKGGRFFFRSQRNPSLVVGFDAGGMGLAPLAPAAHADSLAVTIELAGHPVVVDPGSLIRQDDEGVQEYLRSTGAHSTVRLNWESSALEGPGEIWDTLTPIYDVAYAEITGHRLIMAAASQLGYCRDGERVVHRRMITRDSGDSYHIAIEDRIEGPPGTEFEFELLFHMHPDITSIQKQRDLYQVRVGESLLSLRFSSDNAFEVGATQGHRAPLLGWAAPDGREPRPIWVLRVHGRDKAPILIRTALFPG